MSKYSLEVEYKIFNDETGDCIKLGCDRDGLDGFEISDESGEKYIFLNKEDVCFIPAKIKEILTAKSENTIQYLIECDEDCFYVSFNPDDEVYFKLIDDNTISLNYAHLSENKYKVLHSFILNFEQLDLMYKAAIMWLAFNG